MYSRPRAMSVLFPDTGTNAFYSGTLSKQFGSCRLTGLLGKSLRNVGSSPTAFTLEQGRSENLRFQAWLPNQGEVVDRSQGSKSHVVC